MPRNKAKNAEQVETAKMDTNLCLFSREIQYRQSQYNRRDEVTVLSNVIIHKSEVIIYVEDNKDLTTTQSVWIEPMTSTIAWRHIIIEVVGSIHTLCIVVDSLMLPF